MSMPALNTDREIYRLKRNDPLDLSDAYSPRVFITENQEMGINVGGSVIVMPIEMWHKMAQPKPNCTCQTSVVRDGVCLNCGRPYSSKDITKTKTVSAKDIDWKQYVR